MTRWFEDIPLDTDFDLGEHTFSEDEIIRFGKLYDPQYFHIDPVAAKHSHFVGPIASGWHTVCVGHRKMVDELFAEEDRIRAQGMEPGVSGPSPGVNEMVFKTPVRPNDTVHYKMQVTAKRLSRSLPGWGLLSNEIIATNQRDELVYHVKFAGFSKLRDYTPGFGQKLATALTRIPGLAKLLRTIKA